MSSLRFESPDTREHLGLMALTAASLVGALAAAGFLAGFALLADYSYRETYLTPYSLADNILTAVSFAVLAVTIPGLGRTTGLPRWALIVSAAGCASVAAMAWAFVTVTPNFAEQVTDAQFDKFGPYLLLFPLPKMLFGLVGFIGLGVAGWRRREIPRGASVLFILAGILSLWWAYPPAALLACLAFVWVARSARDKS